MKHKWAESETDLDVKLLASLAPTSVLERASTSANGAERMPIPKTIPHSSAGQRRSRRPQAPPQYQGSRPPFLGDGNHAPSPPASTTALMTANDLLGLQTLAEVSSALAHEVRGPLRWVTSFSELLVQEQGAALDQRGKDYLQRISGAAARLDQVMRDLQQFVAAGIQSPRQQVVSLEAAICAVLGNLASDISAGRAEVSLLRPLPLVRGDSDWIQQCVAHLVDNALKFVSPGASPTIRIWAESGPGVVRLYVEDHGPGIPSMYHERVFGLFTRLSHDFPGTGAGLALTRQFCERMGGRTGVESQPDQGSRFWIELPEAA